MNPDTGAVNGDLEIDSFLRETNFHDHINNLTRQEYCLGSRECENNQRSHNTNDSWKDITVNVMFNMKEINLIRICNRFILFSNQSKSHFIIES